MKFRELCCKLVASKDLRLLDSCNASTILNILNMHEVTLVLIWILRTSVDDLVLVVQVWF